MSRVRVSRDIVEKRGGSGDYAFYGEKFEKIAFEAFEKIKSQQRSSTTMQTAIDESTAN